MLYTSKCVHIQNYPLCMVFIKTTPWAIHSFNHSFIQAISINSASSSPLLLRGAPDTARILCRSFTSKRHRQLRVKDLPRVSMWRLEPATLRTKGDESTKPHTSLCLCYVANAYNYSSIFTHMPTPIYI